MLKSNSDLISKFPRTSCFLAGLLLKFCFCKGATFPIFLIPSFAILLNCILQTPCRRKAFELGYFFGIGYFLSTLYWIAESFKCVGFGNYGYLAVVCLVLYISIYPALACFISRILAKTRLDFLILFSVFWVITEYIRGILFTGFPWNLIGYAPYCIPYFSQIADIVGIYGVSFFTILITSLATMKRTIPHALSIFIIVCSYGLYKENFYKGYQHTETRTVISLIQPSIPQSEKNDMQKFKSNINKHISLSLRSIQGANIYQGQRIVIWPEAAINTPIEPEDQILKYITHEIKSQTTIIIAGCDRYDSDKKLYNSAYVFGGDAKIKNMYDKRHLLPFGEFIPKFLKVCGLRKVTDGIIDFSSGKISRTIKIDGLTPFNIVICYEIAFPGEIIDDKESTWILNLTNDSWFGDTDGPAQHMRVACLRAIEEGRAVARCANNGISCIIDCNGKVVKSLGIDEVGTIEEIMPLKTKETFYSKHKNKTILLLMFLIITYSFVFRPKNVVKVRKVL